MHREGYRRGDQGLVSRLDETLGKPKVVLAVALIAVVLGVLLCGIFLAMVASSPFYVAPNGSLPPKEVKSAGPLLEPIPPSKTRLETEPPQSPAAGSPPPQQH